MSTFSLKAHVHGLSERQLQILVEFDPSARLTAAEVGEDYASSLLERSIPSVPTLEQLLYLTIQQVINWVICHILD